MGIGVQQLSNANSLDVDRKAKAALEQLSKNFPPGLKYAIAFDSTTAVGESIREVLITLVAAIVIVIAVIFLFLLDWRATIIPAVTIPVSLIGTFAFIRIFDFSINSLTLFGITLATGLVVDDAIVVIENVQRHIHMEHSDAHEATSRAMREVTSAVIATSLVLIAVFRAGFVLSRHHRHSLSPVLAHHCVLHRHLGFQCAHAFAGAIGACSCAAKRRVRASWIFSTSRWSHAPLPHSFTAPMHLSPGRPAPMRASSMLRCNCATCFCWCFLPGWAPPCGCTGTFPPALFRRKIRDTSW